MDKEQEAKYITSANIQLEEAAAKGDKKIIDSILQSAQRTLGRELPRIDIPKVAPAPPPLPKAAKPVTSPIEQEKTLTPIGAEGKKSNDKKSFVMYADYLQHIQILSREERGDLLTAILEYANGIQTLELDGMPKMAFSFVKANIDRENAKWEETKEKRIEAAKKGAAARWGTQNEES